MNKFLSKDRKILLQSAFIGSTIIAVLYSILLLNTDSLLLWIFLILGLLSVYWFIPSWFFRNRQLKKVEINLFTSKNLAVNKPDIIKYQYFNADGNEARKMSDIKLFIAMIIGFFINIFLFAAIYPAILNSLMDAFPTFSNIFSDMLLFLIIITPYFTRHIFCFILNKPIENFNLGYSAYSHVKYPNILKHQPGTMKFIYSPAYSFLSFNVNHRPSNK